MGKLWKRMDGFKFDIPLFTMFSPGQRKLRLYKLAAFIYRIVRQYEQARGERDDPNKTAATGDG